MDRIELYNYYVDYLSDGKINNEKFNRKMIGVGGQGYVYLLDFGDNIKIVRKKTYVNKIIKKYIKPEKMYSNTALKKSQFIEILCNILYSYIVLNQINRHFIITYETIVKERNRICNEDYPYKIYNYIEYINGVNLIDYLQNKNGNNKIDIMHIKILIFQLVSGLYTMRKYFTMKHLDLHSENIMIQKEDIESYHKYIIEKDEYIIPDKGETLYILDMGHCYEKNKLTSWFVGKKYKRKEVSNNPVLDIKILYDDLINREIDIIYPEFIEILENVMKDGYLVSLKKLGNELNSLKNEEYKTISNMDNILEIKDENIKGYINKGNKYIFTDGASKDNGKGRTSWGVIVEDNEKLDRLGELKKGSTNNQAELTALYNAYEIVYNNYKLFNGVKTTIICDSEYAIKSITEWYKKWEKNNWKNSKKEEVKNKNLIQRILKLKDNCEKKGLNIWIQHINSHQKEPENKESLEWRLWNGNNRVDKMINELIN